MHLDPSNTAWIQCLVVHINGITKWSHTWVYQQALYTAQLINALIVPLYPTSQLFVCHAHRSTHEHLHNLVSPLSPGLRCTMSSQVGVYFTNSKWNVIYSEKYRHTFIQGIQRITALGQGCLLPLPAANRVNYLISQPTLHKFTSCFSSGKKWREEKSQPELLIAHAAPTQAEILPCCCSRWQTSLQH